MAIQLFDVVPSRNDGLVTLKIANPAVLNDWLGIGANIEKDVERLFSAFLLEVNRYLIRITPLDTGMLRGGWTAYLDSANADYQPELYDTSIAEKAPGRFYHLDPEDVAKGKTFSRFEQPNKLEFTLINEVPYGFYLEYGTSAIPARNFVTKTQYKAVTLFDQYLTFWFNGVAKDTKRNTELPNEKIIA